MSSQANTKHENKSRGFGPRGHMGGMPTEKAKDFKGTLKRLVGYLSSKKAALLFVLVLAAGSSAFAIIGPKELGKATTLLFEGLMAKMMNVPNAAIDFERILQILLFVAGLYVVSSVLAYIQQFVMAGVSQKIVYKMRNEVKDKLGRLPLKYFDGRTHGEILSRVTNDIDTIANTLQQSLTQVITAVTTIIGVIIMMLTISGILTLVSLIVLPLAGILISVVVKKSQKYFIGQQKEIGNINGHVEEMYTGHNIIKAFGKEKKAMQEFDEINEKLYDTAWKAQFMSGIMMPAMTLVNNFAYVLICVIGGVMAINGTITIGNIQAFIQYSRRFSQPIAQTAQISNVMQAAVAAGERVFEILDETEEVEEAANAADITEPKGEVKIENLSFGYVEDKTIIKNMSLDVKSGDVVAIVGPTGAGKTTLVNLLMRFYEINEGSITIDGIELRDMKRSNLRDIFGMVLQDTWLFNGTIRDNIAYSNHDADEESIIKAAKMAYADHFIRTLPDGYDTVINEEGTNISYGQKQLITIARALLANPSILILDEATSSVDTRTESHIQHAMIELMKGRTSFVIAHRLSTIRDASTILVMNDGEIIEQGNHQTLMEANGFYADLYQSQFLGADLRDDIA